MNDPDRFAELVAPHAATLERLLDVHEAAVERWQGDPAAAAAPVVAEIEVQDRYGVPGLASQPIDQAIAAALLYTMAGVDHARAICTLVMAPPTVVFADKVLLRASVEAFARSAWLVESGVGVPERTRRIVNERLESMSRMVQVAKGHERAADARDRRDRLLRGAIEAGLGARGSKRGEVWVGARRPSATGVLRHLLNEAEGFYGAGAMIQAAYSGFVHSALWALQSRMVEDPDLLPLTGKPIPPGMVVRPLASTASDVQWTIALAGGAMILAIDRVRTYLGRSGDEWDNARAEAVETLGPTIRRDEAS